MRPLSQTKQKQIRNVEWFLHHKLKLRLKSIVFTTMTKQIIFDMFVTFVAFANAARQKFIYFNTLGK